jgi:hypothetical protein
VDDTVDQHGAGGVAAGQGHFAHALCVPGFGRRRQRISDTAMWSTVTHRRATSLAWRRVAVPVKGLTLNGERGPAEPDPALPATSSCYVA